MRTQDWINKLERPIPRLITPAAPVNQMSDAIIGGFDWWGTPEGSLFWLAACEELRRNNS